MEKKGPIIKEPQVLLKIIETGCDVIIACNRQINLIDSEFGKGNYGTVLSCAAEAIKTAIKDNQLCGERPYTTFSEMAKITKIATATQDETYALIFETVAKSFLTHDDTTEITPAMWLFALDNCIKAITINIKLNVQDRCILDALVPVKLKLSQSLEQGSSPLDAFGDAVRAAEISATQTVEMKPRNSDFQKAPKYPAAEAHAVGIWMRGAYEAMKLSSIYQ